MVIKCDEVSGFNLANKPESFEYLIIKVRIKAVSWFKDPTNIIRHHQTSCNYDILWYIFHKPELPKPTYLADVFEFGHSIDLTENTNWRWSDFNQCFIVLQSGPQLQYSHGNSRAQMAAQYVVFTCFALQFYIHKWI